MTKNSGLDIRPYEEDDSALWDDFIDKSINGTIFHRRKFLDYHPQERFKDSSLLFHFDNKLTGVFPSAVITDNGKGVLKSHPGSSYGGIIVKGPVGVRKACLMVEGLEGFSRRHGLERIEFRLPPKIYNIFPADELDFAFKHNGFQIRDFELSTCYPMERLSGAEPTDEHIISTFDNECGRATKKALKSGLEARICADEADFNGYWDILALNLMKHNTKPTHSKEELLDLKRRFPEDVQLIGVFHGKEIIAGIVTFIVNRNASHIFYFGSLYEHQEKRPLNLAVLRLIQYAAGRGLKYVKFGISTEKGGRVVNWGLFRFKEGFGGHGVVRTYWVKELS